MTRKRFFPLFVTILLAGCGEDPETDTRAALPEASLPGVYSGVFPCEGCPGITATLWLRNDRTFFFRQQYPAGAVGGEMDVYNLGRWRTVDEDQFIEAAGSGPKRTFTRRDRDTLVMQTDSELEHRLTRDPKPSNFSASIRMSGIMRAGGSGVFFAECLTGLAAPVSKDGDFARFRHQFRSIGGQKQPTYAELEGRFSWSSDGTPQSLKIERFITVREDGTC